MHAVVIFGAGSPLVVDYEESAARAGLRIAVAVRNMAGECPLLDPSLVIDVADLTAELKQLPFLVPLFTPANRMRAAREARQLGFARPHSLIDPTAIRPRRLVHGDGLYINAGCTLGAASQFGEFVLVNRGVTLGHHAVCGDFCSIGPGAVVAGNVSIGRGAMIGAGAVVLPKCSVGDNAVVGAGAVVTKDLPANCLAVGNPASIVRRGLPSLEERAATGAGPTY
jgi:sugar O-acyltransferase (sialic acid O-acetyltransferase NeuD family)